MRNFINMMETYDGAVLRPSDILEDHLDDQQQPDSELIEQLSDIIFRLRQYSEPQGGDYAIGFESGLEMAAAMIENLVNRMGESSGS